MIGKLLGVEPLLGQHVTKPVVLARICSVSPIHIDAHDNNERGKIALAPARAISKNKTWLICFYS